MAVKTRYYTTGAGTEEKEIPELQEIAGAAAQPAQEAAAPAAPAPVTPAPSYSSNAGQQQSALYQQIAERGPFQYDPGKDPLYQVARDRYVQQGRMAMKDSMGQAAALTGGYGSSYGQAVGQQTYDKNLQGLADMIPELYQAAYSRYQDEGDRLQRQYQMLGEQEARDYSRYRDQMGDWQYERAWQQEKEDADYARRNEAYTRLYTLIGATGYMPSAEEMEAAGMTKEQAEALRNEYLRQTGQLPVETGGGDYGGGYGGGSGSGSGTGAGIISTSRKWADTPVPAPNTEPNSSRNATAQWSAWDAAGDMASKGMSQKDVRDFVKAETKASDDEVTEWMESRNKKRPDSKTRN